MIPKKVWQCYKSKQLRPVLQAHVDKQKKENPSWEFILWDDDDIRTFIKEQYDEEVLGVFNSLTSGAGKADFWRYLVLNKFGGVYLDLDSEIIVPLDKWIKDDDECILTNEGCTQPLDHWPHRNVNRCMVQWALVFAPNHPFLAKIIENVTNNIKRKYCSNNLLKCTGPVAYTSSIIDCILSNTIAKFRITERFDYDGCLSFENSTVKAAMYDKNEYWRNQQNHIK